MAWMLPGHAGMDDQPGHLGHASRFGSLRGSLPPPPPPARDGTIPSPVMDKGLDFERERNWAAAIETYRKALERWPSKTEFSRRLRLCELHFKLIRRYQDVSFRGVLLRLPREQAIDLYAEVLERIQDHYVDPVPLEPLVRHGLDNLEVALRDPLFVRTNVGTAAPERVTWLRDQFRDLRGRLSVADRDAALRLALAACDLARQGIEHAPHARAPRIHLRRL